MSDGKTEVPAFIQIVTAVSNAFGRGENDLLITDALYGLDGQGRVWQWMIADPDRQGSVDGWRLLPAVVHEEGIEAVPQRKTR